MTEKELVCVVCPMGCRITVTLDGENIVSVTGNSCPRGKAYAEKECIRPERILTTTVRLEGGVHRVLPVITDKEIPLDRIFEAMEEVRKVSVKAPVTEGQIIIENILDTGANLIASRSMEEDKR
jgi:CxxC motif-containing protein